jgi:DNA gyrase subunit A
MATNIPPHNLTEVIDATVHLIENPNATLKHLMTMIPGPDFPTGGFIYGREGIRNAYETGRGSIVMRAKVSIDRAGKSADRMAIVVNAIPYQVNKAKLIERIAELVNEKRIEAHLRSPETNRSRRHCADRVEAHSAADPCSTTYQLTSMQSFGVINLAIVNGQPRELPLIDTINIFIEHRREVITRRTRFDLRCRSSRSHTGRAEESARSPDGSD